MIRQKRIGEIIVGSAMLALGAYCFIRPDLAAYTLSRIFAVFLLLFGFVNMNTGFTMRHFYARWYLQVFEGLVYTVLAVVLLVIPTSLLFFTRVLGLWAIIVGMFRFVTASIRQVPFGFTTFGGFISFLFGLLLFAYPQFIAGMISIIIGIILILLGMLVLSGSLFVWKNRF